MSAFALTAVLFLIVHYVCASCPGNPSPVQRVTLVAALQACRTGTLKIHADDTSTDWLYHYRLYPTKESVDKVGRILLGELGKGVAPSQQHALTAILKTQIRANSYYSWDFLTKYAIYKTLLCGRSSGIEAEALKAIFSEISTGNPHSIRLQRLIDGLADAKCDADLFAVLVASDDALDVANSLSYVSSWHPGTISRLIREYGATKNKAPVNISHTFFSNLLVEDKYELLRTCLVPDYSLGFVEVRVLYILSRFSELPSNDVKNRCIGEEPKYQVYEEAVQETSGNLLIKMDCLDPENLPTDIWANILLCCSDMFFQVYTIPRVCRFWRDLHHVLLSRSLAVHQEFVNDLQDISAISTRRKHRPWNYFLNSPWSFLKYALLCQNDARIRNDPKIVEFVGVVWEMEVKNVVGRSPLAPSQSYLDLYVRCCRAHKKPLSFHQPRGMSDDEYVALIKRLVAEYGIVPNLPKKALEGCCGRFVKMLENDAALIALLFQGNPTHYDKLAIHLFLTRSQIPAQVDALLYANSTLHRLLTNEDDSVEKYLNIILSINVDMFGTATLARYLIGLCLAAKSKSDSDLRMLGARLWDSYIEQWLKTYTVDDDDAMVRRWEDRFLNYGVMEFLNRHVKDYTDEEISIVLRVLEQCGVLSERAQSRVLENCLYNFMASPKSTIELVR